MNSESNSKTARTQASKPASYKRVHRANSPSLVTAEADALTMQPIEEAMQPVTQIAVEERPSESQTPRRRIPAFFTSIGRGSKGVSEADPNTARMARALRSKSVDHIQEEKVSTKKPAVSASKAGAASNRPPSRFKMRYLWGMMIYVLVAEYLGGFVTNYMQANHWDAVLFSWNAPWGPFQLTRSILIFLAILVVVLIVMARFDLIPSSLGKMVNGNVASGKNSKQAAPTFETKASQPVMQQGVKGSNDNLYQEYRSNQRYFQKRDRKR